VSVDDRLDLAVALSRDHRGDVSSLKIGQDRIGVIAIVAEQHPWNGAWFGHDRRVALDVVDLSAGQNHGDRQTQAIASQVDFCRETAARTAKTLVRTPFFAPAECWWARMNVLSIIWTLSCPSPESFTAFRMTSQRPEALQRWNCR
jgi:hypothetical protein